MFALSIHPLSHLLTSNREEQLKKLKRHQRRQLSQRRKIRLHLVLTQ